MREDTWTRDEQGAAEVAAIRGRSESIGSDDGDQEPNPLYTRTLGPDPWAPWTCPKCGDETPSGAPEVCICGWRNWGAA